MSGSNSDNALLWAPSTWQPGQPPTAGNVDTSQSPMPTSDQIAAQRALIQQRLKQYGYPAQQLTDQQVLATMTNQPQGPVQYPPWAQDYINRNPGSVFGARPGVDMPANQTFEDYNLRARGLGGTPTNIGYANAIPYGAQVEHYGQAAVDKTHQDWIVEHSTPGATLRLVDATHPQGFDVTVPGGGAQPYASGTPNAPPNRNALAFASSSPAAANWVQQLQQQNPSFWDQLMRWIALRQQQYGPGFSAPPAASTGAPA